MRSEGLKQLELNMGFECPEKHSECLGNTRDPIHELVYLLGSELNDPQGIAVVNKTLRSEAAWQGWSDNIIAFATNGVADYFVYDLSTSPYAVFYVDPAQTIAQSKAMCVADDFIFPDFEQWYAYIVESS